MIEKAKKKKYIAAQLEFYKQLLQKKSPNDFKRG